MIEKVDKSKKNFEKKLEEIALLEEEIFPRTAYPYSELFDMIVRFEQYRFFYIEEEGKILAYSLLLDAIDCFEILKIAVQERHRRRGLGEKLLEEISNKDICLEVREGNFPARAFYKECGFREIARREEYYSDTKEAAIIMKRNKDGGAL